MKQCADCRDCERNYVEDDVILVYVRDPDTNKMLKRAYMCEDHQAMYDNDGYEVKPC